MDKAPPIDEGLAMVGTSGVYPQAEKRQVNRDACYQRPQDVWQRASPSPNVGATSMPFLTPTVSGNSDEIRVAIKAQTNVRTFTAQSCKQSL